jgi:hypothetical protein
MTSATLSARLERVDPFRALAIFSAAVAVLFTLVTLRFSWLHCYFYGDDYETFLMMRDGPFPSTLFTPLGSQVVPLHRALTFLTWRLAPMNYALAIGLLTAFHAVAAVYLYRLLELMRHTGANAAIVAIYACYSLLVTNLAWYSSGMTRFPYLAFTLAALYHHALHVRTGRARHLVILCLCYVLALGFYSKAILLPICCAGLHLAARVARPRDEPRAPRSTWLVLGALLLVGLVYAHAVRSFLDPLQARTNTNARFLAQFLGRAFEFYGNSLFGNVLDYDKVRGSPVVAMLWLAFFAYSVARVPRLVWVWAIGGVVIALNLLVVGASNRTLYFGLLMAYEFRHYFELGFLAALFIGIIVHSLQERGADAPWRRSRRWNAVAACLAGTAVVANALVAQRGMDWAWPRRLEGADKTRAYVRNLEADLAQTGVLSDARATFVDDFIPVYLLGMSVTFRRLSQLAASMNLDLKFAPEWSAKYRVDGAGHVVQNYPRRRRRHPPPPLQP